MKNPDFSYTIKSSMLETSNEAIFFPHIDTPLESLIHREPKPIIYSEDFSSAPSSFNAKTSHKEDIEFGFDDTEKLINKEIDIQFEEINDHLAKNTEIIKTDETIALKGHIEFETSNDLHFHDDFDTNEEPLILEFEAAMHLNQNENVTLDTDVSIEFGTILSNTEYDKTSNDSDIEITQPEAEVETNQKASLFEDDKYKAKILTAIKMRDLNFESEKITTITGISVKEMQEFESYLEQLAAEELKQTSQSIEDKTVANETKSNDDEKVSLPPISSHKLIQENIKTDEIEKQPFLSWLETLNPSENNSDKENTKSPSLKKSIGVEDNFEFEGQQYILEEEEFNEPIKNYIQEQIDTKNTKINPEETYKPKSLHAIDFEEIVSETLAILYINQGHKEKGIRMYKKLILKFPEKSVYFASEIKKLK